MDCRSVPLVGAAHFPTRLAGIYQHGLLRPIANQFNAEVPSRTRQRQRSFFTSGSYTACASILESRGDLNLQLHSDALRHRQPSAAAFYGLALRVDCSPRCSFLSAETN